MCSLRKVYNKMEYSTDLEDRYVILSSVKNMLTSKWHEICWNCHVWLFSDSDIINGSKFVNSAAAHCSRLKRLRLPLTCKLKYSSDFRQAHNVAKWQTNNKQNQCIEETWVSESPSNIITLCFYVKINILSGVLMSVEFLNK
jgi:hypothetical protein